MKNYWLAARKARALRRLFQIVKTAIKTKLWLKGLQGGGFPWQSKGTKTPP